MICFSEPMRARKAILARALSSVALAGAAAGLLVAGPAGAKVEGDTIILGSANSLTGKYSSNGIDTPNGYALAIKVLNQLGGVTGDGHKSKLAVPYYAEQPPPAPTATPPPRTHHTTRATIHP